MPLPRRRERGGLGGDGLRGNGEEVKRPSVCQFLLADQNPFSRHSFVNRNFTSFNSSQGKSVLRSNTWRERDTPHPLTRLAQSASPAGGTQSINQPSVQQSPTPTTALDKKEANSCKNKATQQDTSRERDRSAARPLPMKHPHSASMMSCELGARLAHRDYLRLV